MSRIKRKKKIALALMSLFMVGLLAVQVTASWGGSNWATFRVPRGGAATSQDTGGRAVIQSKRQPTNRVRFESRWQTMWTTPQVRAQSTTLMTNWYSLNASNNSNTVHVLGHISNTTGRTYTLHWRSSVLQLGSNTLDGRFNVDW
ncbi:MAG: hypothetical protein FWF76_03910 [Oscillospiraceae bacterium]|nr:hypothetical protein [Oscillospiraceae bacterium]